MSDQKLGGVIAAIATPLAGSEPDLQRFSRLASFLMANGCDGLNILGTTGEATSFSVAQRMRVMEHVAKVGLGSGKLMVGTGTASIADTLDLTRHAASLGFGGALVLPPFYYKGIGQEGLLRYFDVLAEATAEPGIPLYLYNFPAMTGIKYEIDDISRLLTAFGDRIAGLKDSSGDIDYAREAAGVSTDFDVFPSNEGTLAEARDGTFSGCISATANLNSIFCQAALHDSDDGALSKASRIRALLDGKPLVPGIKALLSRIHGDDGLAATLPPLVEWSKDMTDEAYKNYEAIVAED